MHQRTPRSPSDPKRTTKGQAGVDNDTLAAVDG